MIAFVVGVGLILIGGFASGSFYIPYKKVKKWNWEIYWITGGLFSWIFMPWLAALLTVPNLFSWKIAGGKQIKGIWIKHLGEVINDQKRNNDGTRTCSESY